MEGAEYQYVNLYAAGMALCGLLFAVFFYRNPEEVEGKKAEMKTLPELLLGLRMVLANWRFLSLIIITGLFWCIQGQLYATMPKYLFRMVGLESKPGWIANVNPLTVVILVIPVTHLVRKIRPVSSIGIAFLIIPLSALPVGIAPMLGVKEVSLGFATVNTIILMMIIGIVFQGVAECFLSPRFLEYASKQAPEGEVGLYMGYSHLNAGFGWLFGFVISGYLLDIWCPDPARLPAGISAVEKAAYYAHAHYIWYVFTAIGVLGFVLLLAFRGLTDRIDARNG
jgi:dipeptide/tripeptide permease